MQVVLDCTGEAPENVTVMIQCNEAIITTNTYLVEYSNQPLDINKTLTVPQNEQCSLSIVFSNAVGSSEPFVLTLGESVIKVFTCLCLILTDTNFPDITSSILPSVTVAPTTKPVSPSQSTGSWS